MMKTTLTGRFLGMMMLAGLLMAPSAEGSDQVTEARTPFAAPAQSAGPGNGSTIVVALIPVAESPVGVSKTLRLAEPQIASGVTDLGIPSWLYCKLHPRWGKNL